MASAQISNSVRQEVRSLVRDAALNRDIVRARALPVPRLWASMRAARSDVVPT